jgi:hypothetical protein
MRLNDENIKDPTFYPQGYPQAEDRLEFMRRRSDLHPRSRFLWVLQVYHLQGEPY